MKNMPIGKVLFHYFKERRKVIVMFVLYQLIFCLVCALYQLDNLPKLLYAAWICVFISLWYGIWNFTKYRRHIDKIDEASINIEDLPNLLPQAGSLQENRYQEIAKSLFDKCQQLLFNADLRQTEMIDYYTLWAHQIKTPIAAIKLLLQNDEKQGISYTLLEELFKIEQYVEMVLHYLRLESMSADMLFKEYELRSIVNQAIKKHSILFINSKLSLNMEAFSCTVVTDEKWLLFVIEQIISNAVKYTPHGSISVYMEKDSEKKLLIIEDTGIGIRSEDLPRIFERGFTGYNGRLDKKSTGIGLYLCKQILDKLSHKIEVQSELGKGTRVSIDFSQQNF